VHRITGHHSAAVYEEYSSHITDENIAKMYDLGRTAFAGILAA
jgi:hypothetical protein